jgi:hypothetical protein
MSYGSQRATHFDEAISMLDKKLVALAVRRGLSPPDAMEDEGRGAAGAFFVAGAFLRQLDPDWGG